MLWSNSVFESFSALQMKDKLFWWLWYVTACAKTFHLGTFAKHFVYFEEGATFSIPNEVGENYLINWLPVSNAFSLIDVSVDVGVEWCLFSVVLFLLTNGNSVLEERTTLNITNEVGKDYLWYMTACLTFLGTFIVLAEAASFSIL